MIRYTRSPTSVSFLCWFVRTGRCDICQNAPRYAVDGPHEDLWACWHIVISTRAVALWILELAVGLPQCQFYEKKHAEISQVRLLHRSESVWCYVYWLLVDGRISHLSWMVVPGTSASMAGQVVWGLFPTESRVVDENFRHHAGV
jgi:hypothetical protein